MQREDGGIPLPRASNTGGVPRVPEPQVQLQPREEKRVPSRGTDARLRQPASRFHPPSTGHAALAESGTEISLSLVARSFFSLRTMMVWSYFDLNRIGNQ